MIFSILVGGVLSQREFGGIILGKLYKIWNAAGRDNCILARKCHDINGNAVPMRSGSIFNNGNDVPSCSRLKWPLDKNGDLFLVDDLARIRLSSAAMCHIPHHSEVARTEPVSELVHLLDSSFVVERKVVDQGSRRWCALAMAADRTSGLAIDQGRWLAHRCRQRRRWQHLHVSVL